MAVPTPVARQSERPLAEMRRQSEVRTKQEFQVIAPTTAPHRSGLGLGPGRLGTDASVTGPICGTMRNMGHQSARPVRTYKPLDLYFTRESQTSLASYKPNVMFALKKRHRRHIRIE